MKTSVRTLISLLLFISGTALAQTIVLSPAKGYNERNVIKVKVFFARTDSLILETSAPVPAGTKFKIGSSSGNYLIGSVDMSGTRKAFVPGNAPLSLSTGRYYGVLTNSAATTLSAISQNAQSNTSIKFSNEIQFIVEASTAPSPTDPRGTITNATPLFQWNAIPGVPAYWVVLSSTPFVVRTDSTGNVSVQGANVVWDYIVTGTSAMYGLISPYSPFTQSAIPLFSGNTYYYTVLNLYDATDVALASSVFGGVVSFTYQSATTVQIPNLVLPAENATYQASNTIRFQWDPVPNVNSYTLYIFKRITQFAGSNQELDVPLWNGTTTNTVFDFPARQNLSKGKYVWLVVPNTSTGAGQSSLKRVFTYNVDISKFSAQAFSTFDNTNIVNFTLSVTSTTGGYAPPVPYVVSSAQYLSDSIPSDNYRFTIKAAGYYDSSVTAAIAGTENTLVNVYLRPFPSTVTGKVVDQAGAGVGAATVNFLNVLTNESQNYTTGGSGDFSVNVPKASYKISVSKPGYLSPAVRSLTVDVGQLIINQPFTLTADNAGITGTVINDEGQPIQLASVKATKGTTVQEATTNATGNYSFQLSSGTWTVEAAKTGFVSPTPLTLNLSTGANLQNQNLTLTPRANQVTGTAYKVTTSGTTTSLVPVQGVTITALPVTGQAVTATSNASGFYQLSLKSGTYTLSAQLQGHTPNASPQVTVTVGQTLPGNNFNLTPNPSSVSGVITETGGALLGDVIVKTGMVTGTSLPTGTYEISLPAGTHTLTATKAGYVTPATVTVNLSPGQSLSGINFSMNPNAATISGRITSLGQSLSQATVTAKLGTNTITTTSDNSGNYVLSVQPGTYTLSAAKQGFIAPAAETFFVGAGQTSPGHDFSLTENIATVRGAIQSTNGALLSGVQMTIKEKNNPQVSYSTQSGLNGDYSFSVPAGVEYTLTGTLAGYSSFAANIAAPAPRATVVQNGSLAPVPAVVSGKVLNNQQQPVGNAAIQLTQGSTVIDQMQTDLNGVYSLGAGAGTYLLKASLPGYTSDSLSVTLQLGQTLNNVNLKINPNFALVSGTVKDNSNAVLEGALISITGTAGGGSANSSAAGTYSIQQIIGGTYTITVRKTGYGDITLSSQAILPGETKQLNFTMQQLRGTISGKATRQGTTTGLAEVSVSITDAGGVVYSAITNASGDYSVAGLPFGTLTVSALKTGYTSTQQIPVTLSVGNQTGTANITDLKLNDARIQGTVTDVSNNPLSDVQLLLRGAAGSSFAVTNLTGQFAISELADGFYSLITRKNGYVSDSIALQITGTVSRTIKLSAANTRITGTVRTKAGTVHTIPIPIKIISGTTSATTNTDAQGNYAFDNLSSNATYVVLSELFREGYTNDDSTFYVPAGVSAFGPIPLTVPVSKSKIKGNAGAEGVSVRVVDAAQQQFTATSSSDGSYTVDFLLSGSYTVRAFKTGYVFAPATQAVTVGVLDSQTVNFTATQQIGTIVVNAKSGGANLSGVTVTAVSSNNQNIYTALTGSNGTATMANVASGSYTVRAEKNGYTAVTAQKSVTVNNNATATENFDFTANTSNITGKVALASGAGIQNATVLYRNTASGQTITVTSGNGGNFSFPGLPAGQAVVTSLFTGYVSDSVSVNLAVGQTLNVQIKLSPTFVTLRGWVLYKSVGVKDVTLTAVSSGTYTTKTAADGMYEFTSLPIKIGANDTTVYTLTISGTDIRPQTKTIAIPAALASQVIQSGTIFNLFRGQITATLTDGKFALPGVSLTFVRPDGSTTNAVTDNTGIFQTIARLSKGTYKLSVSKDEYLTPGESLIRFELPTDTTVLSRTIPLPYRYTPVATMDASTPTLIKMKFVPPLTTPIAYLYYRQGTSGEFTRVEMNSNGADSTFRQSIPALFSLTDVYYYMTATDGTNTYTSETYLLKPEAGGILSSLSLFPSMNNTLLRANDSYKIGIDPRDGKNVTMLDSLRGSGAGTVKWEVSDTSAIQISFPISTDKTVAELKMLKEGNYRVEATANLRGSVVRSSASVGIRNVPLKKVEVTGTQTSVSNKSPGVQFTYSGIDTSSSKVVLGGNLRWSITPKEAGAIDSTGFYKPVDDTYIGTVTATATDNLSGKKGSSDVVVYADVTPTSQVVLTDKQGMTFSLKSGAVDFPIKVTLDKQQFGPGKKYFTPVGANTSYVVADKQYFLAYSADRALSNNALKNTATFTIPVDNSIKYFEGTRSVGFYDFETNEWNLVPTTAPSSDQLSTEVQVLGEYSILVENQPLGISNAAVLPNPFSPMAAPLKIGYQLSSTQPPASVTIKIFNMRGELIRTLLQNDLQNVGLYGSKDLGIKEVLWDGKNDYGNDALNGRYVIQIAAKDPTGETSKLIPVVLVK